MLFSDRIHHELQGRVRASRSRIYHLWPNSWRGYDERKSARSPSTNGVPYLIRPWLSKKETRCWHPGKQNSRLLFSLSSQISQAFLPCCWSPRWRRACSACGEVGRGRIYRGEEFIVTHCSEHWTEISVLAQFTGHRLLRRRLLKTLVSDWYRPGHLGSFWNGDECLMARFDDAQRSMTEERVSISFSRFCQ